MRLVADQFKRIRNADRYWYESVLAPYQTILNEIKGTTLGDVIKRNSDVTTISLNPFTKVALKK